MTDTITWDDLGAIDGVTEAAVKPVDDLNAAVAAIKAADDDKKTDLARDYASRAAHFDVIAQQRWRNAIKEAAPGLTKGDWDSIVKQERAKAKEKAKRKAEAEKAIKEAADAEAARAAAEAATGQQRAEPASITPLNPDLIPDGYCVPAGWECDRNGIHKLVERRDGETVALRVAYGPIIPVAIHTDPDGDQLVELAWSDGRRWVTRVVSRATAKSGKKLVAALGDAGFPAIESTGKDVEQWLAAVEAYNRDLIPESRIARWLGWQPDGKFISSADDTRIEVAHPEQVPALRAHRPVGTLESWREAVAHIEKLPAAKVLLYAGVAPVLLEVLGVDSFTIDVSGRSTRGKTTAAKVGLSCWADPSEKGDGTFSWRTTTFAIEKRLNLVRGLPVLLDETRVVTRPEMVDEVLYQVSKNHGKARSGGYPSLLPWSTIVLSTGEQPALSFTTHQGASARVLSITRPPFADDGDAAVKVGRGVDEHYGHAGPLFVQHLQKGLAKDGGREWLVNQHREYAEKLKGPNDLSARRAPLVAVLALAADLFHRWDIAPALTKLEEQVWLDLFAAEEATDNRPEMALDVVREYVAANSAGLWWPKCAKKDPPGGWIGRVGMDGGGQVVYLLPETVRRALQRAGIELETVLPAWIDNGWLIRCGDKKRPYQPIQRMCGTSLRTYGFTRSAIEVDIDTSDPMERDSFGERSASRTGAN